ncbi:MULTISPECIES: MFS transporter [unclassified Streptomyces]|uniref:MFS transporter n=1 Tax=unclassified Streptomyces TaxID=2593676 RepID=UPI000F5BF74E|nr:MFS transporter [Streptomyces sp. ADI95-17]RPK72784.1 Major Facilitator Superfamily protein [Streptomyces sp. ADI95-17]WSX01091.1 MFS transporter [Streptomyces sp. NBC_00987]
MYLATTGRRDTPVRPRSGGAGRRVPGTVLALGTVSLVTDISSEMVTAVLPLYLVLGLGLSPLQFGFLDGLFNGVAAVVRLLGGYAADRGRGHKRVAGLGYALSALSRLGLLLAGGATAGIAAALATDRVGKGIRTAPRDALITLSSPPEALGRSFGVHRAMDTTGALLGPLAAFALLWATADAYDAVFVVSFCVGLLGVLLLVLYVPGQQPDLPVRPAPPVRPVPRGRKPFEALRDPAFRRILAAASLLGAATIGDAFVYLLLQDRLDLPVSWFPLLPLGAAACYLLLAIPAGRIADRVGRRLPFLYGHLALLGVYATLLAPVGGPALLLLVPVLVLLGVFYATTDGVLMALAGPVLPTDGRAGGLAVLQTGQALARLLAAAGFGAAWTLWGPGPALWAALSALLAALAGGWALLPRDPSGTPAPGQPQAQIPERRTA